MSSELGLLLVGAVVGGFVQGISGFAFVMVAMSIWVWGVEPVLAVQVGVFGGMVGQMLSVLTVRRGLHLSLLLPFLVGGAVGVPIGMWILPHLSHTLFKLVVGSILVVSCTPMLFAARLPVIRGGGAASDGLAGVAAGVMGGVGGFTGAVPALWGIVRGYSMDEHRAVVQNFNLIALAAIFAGHVASGAITTAMLPKFVMVALALIVPALLGARIYTGLPPHVFRRIVLVLLTFAGVVMVISALF